MLAGKLSGVLWLVFLMWSVFLLDTQLNLNLLRFGIVPRDADHLPGIVIWPFLHANTAHLVSNTVSFLVLGSIVSIRERTSAFLLLSLYITLYAGLGVWIVGRDALHIGASGLVFGYFGYILSRGIYDGKISSVVIASAVMIFFGGMLWGVMPTDRPVSWEGHLCGFIAGVVLGVRQKSGRLRASRSRRR